ncbi:MAG: single-stranded DNA-binding protein [Tenericutes bacterium]|nr:single-stranded DNA-binding protein [Mycoplasmatota bacterium]
MLNQIVLAGRLVSNPEITTTENNKKKTLITVAVPRSYKNIDGNYDTDFIRCTLWNGIAESTCEYCKKGDVVAIKGRLQTSSYEKDDERKYVTDVVAEKVSFLSSAKKTDEEQ